MSTDTANLQAELDRLLERGVFRARRQSWIAVQGGRFFKIWRESDSPGADLTHPEGIRQASDEERNAGLLSRLDEAVNAPIARLDACLVSEELTGHSLVELARSGRPGEFQRALEEAVEFMARLHRVPPEELSELQDFDYTSNPYHRFRDYELKQFDQHPRTVVVRGLEVRNFQCESPGGRLRFFDPHPLWLGYPEEDFCRFVLSILMLNWGTPRALVFHRFDLESLLERYTAIRGASLDPHVLSSMFSFNVAVRREYALRSVARMRRHKRVAARAYLKIYFRQIDVWASAHALHHQTDPKASYQDDEIAETYHEGFARLRGWKQVRYQVVAARERKLVRSFLERVPHAKVLDLPTGTGKLAPILQQLGAEVTACDVSGAMLKVAAREYERTGYDRVRFQVTAAEKLSEVLPGERFDAIACLRLLHLLPPDTQQAVLAEFAKVADHVVVSFGVDNAYHRARRLVRTFLMGGGAHPRQSEPIEAIEARVTQDFRVIDRGWVLPGGSQEIVYLLKPL